MMGTTHKHPNVELLRVVYNDLTRIADYSDDNVILHTADREIPGRVKRVVGKEAVLAKEIELIHLTNNTLIMDVEDITANDHFGAVLGKLRVRLERKEMAMPFCGLWRFRNGKIVEHWENAYDVAAFGEFLTQSQATVGSAQD